VFLPRGFGPTGVVYNGSRAFKGDDLIFASEDGTIAGVMRDALSGTPRGPAIPPTGANYKGVTIGSVHGRLRLFVADFGDGMNDFGKVAVFNDDYEPRNNDHDFLDPDVPNDYAPFNVLAAGNFLIVTYAKRSATDPGDDQSGAGLGIVALFTLEGKLVKELVPGGDQSQLNAPWALALSPEKGEKKSVDLLVGNFGDGHINVYEISMHGKEVRADFEGAIFDNKTHQPLVIDRLWGFAFGNGKGGFDADDLYFNAGPEDETEGLFGELSFVGRRK
jgi:uncharacterized protein (TIGR03118 family)